MKDHVRDIDVRKLHSADPGGVSLIIRIMMACNDLMLSNSCLSFYKESQLPENQEHLKHGAELYFVRLQAGHICEALDLMKELKREINKNKILKSAYDMCETESKHAYDVLCECLQHGTQYEEFEVTVKNLRNKAAFHYREKSIFDDAIKHEVSNLKSSYKITITGNVKSSRYNVADNIINTVVCHYIWKVQAGDLNDIESKVNEKSDFAYDLVRKFIFFCEDFIHKYLIKVDQIV